MPSILHARAAPAPPSSGPSPVPGEFTCDACAQRIPAAHPRVHCLVCADHDLCAVCALQGQFVGGHASAHLTTVYTAGVASRTSISYGADVAAVPFPVPAGASQASSTVSQGGTGVPQQMHGDAAEGWQPFFYADMNPTPTFTGLMDAIFTHLDPGNTGCLAPETFSRMLDDMGYTTQENAWKAHLTASLGQTQEDAADAALKRAFDAFSIEHICRQRPRAPGLLGIATSAGAGPMPLLTRRGLISITSVELLCDPSGEHPKLARLVQLYALQPHARWGAMPRGVLPPSPDPRMLARLAAVQSGVQASGRQQLAAAHSSAMLRAQANQAALGAIGTTVYEYEDRYRYRY
ncbi:hypothetical protein DFH09DRAFT_1368542 [Mycena vulgaris]|nr:hypothetical protein DFH09DRAFT_1368542 [Mycena vulgaris]